MTIKRFLTCTALALAGAFPAAAAAQTPIEPPGGDNYLAPVALSDFDNPGRFPGQEIGFVADTSAYTVQADMFSPPASGGPPEPTGCGNSAYGNTIWAVFYADRYGVMNISTAGPFDSVIGVIPFDGPANAEPDIRNGACYDRLAGFEEEAQGLVSPRQWYAVQVGGTGSPQGGPVQVKFNLEPPPQVDGQAFLFWKTGPLRVSDMHVKNVPAGQTLQLRCTKRACKKKNIRVRSRNGGSLGKLFRTVDWSPGPGASPKMAGASAKADVDSPNAAFKPIARSAVKKVKLLRNQKVKRGAKIVLRIKRPGFVGKHYRWKVKRNSISSAKLRCMNPGSNKPRKRCNG